MPNKTERSLAVEITKSATMITYQNSGRSGVKITFPFNYDDLNLVKTLSGRKFHGDQYPKFWSCPLTIESVEFLKSWGFGLDEKLEEFLNKKKELINGVKISVDFSLCPLCNIYNGAWEIIKKGGQENAKREISTEKGENSRSTCQSGKNIEGKRYKLGMEGKSFCRNQTSNAFSESTREAPGGMGKSKGKVWDEFQRREWTGNDPNSETCKRATLSLWLYKGIPNPNQTCERQVRECSDCLQSRLRPSDGQNSYRVGWGNSSRVNTKENGREKRPNTESPWLDCNTLASLNSFRLIPGIQYPLYQFQLEDVLKMEQMEGRVLIASEMGLGKTIQSLAWLQLHPEKRPAIIVVPASLKLNWEKEAKLWMSPEPNIQILFGKKMPESIIGDIIIINYDILPTWLEQLQRIKPQVLVLDEIHYVKNNKTHRTKAVKALGKDIPHILGLSGTPIVNRPVEAYNAIKLIDPTAIPSFWEYTQKYCDAKHNSFGWNFNGASNTEELHRRLTGSVMIRRKKVEVLAELPDKTFSVVPIEIDNRKEYQKAESNFINWVRENQGDEKAQRASNAEALARIEGLKQLTVKGKLNQVIDWITDFLEVGGKLVVFATHKLTIDVLMETFGDQAVKIDGSVSTQARQDVVDKFQNDPSCRLFVGNVKAAGVGITLTASSSVAFVELPWTPGELSQASDRVHRIGQKNAVNIYYLLARGSIEETISEMLDRKRKVLDSILDGKETDEQSMLSELLNSYRN